VSASSSVVCFLHRRPAVAAAATVHRRNLPEIAMGKYVLAWLLGVPVGLLMLIYVLAHL